MPKLLSFIPPPFNMTLKHVSASLNFRLVLLSCHLMLDLLKGDLIRLYTLQEIARPQHAGFQQQSILASLPILAGLNLPALVSPQPTFYQQALRAFQEVRSSLLYLSHKTLLLTRKPCMQTFAPTEMDRLEHESSGLAISHYQTLPTLMGLRVC